MNSLFNLYILFFVILFINKSFSQVTSIVNKEQYLKDVSVSEFDCLKKCAKDLAEPAIAEDDPNDKRSIESCANRDVYPSCKPTASDVVQIHEGKYVFQLNKKVAWAQAVLQCRAMNMQIITINTEALSNKIAAYLSGKGMNGPFWSGGVTLDENQVWLETGSPVLNNLVTGGNKSPPNSALAFSVSGKQLAWEEPDMSKQYGLACEIPDECFSTRCLGTASEISAREFHKRPLISKFRAKRSNY